jgi:hypothetical protein
LDFLRKVLIKSDILGSSHTGGRLGRSENIDCLGVRQSKILGVAVT